MEADELIAKAWKAVEKASVPEALQEAAFREAIAFLRSAEPGAASDTGGGSNEGTPRATKTKNKRTATKGTSHSEAVELQEVDEDSFFKRLADESGIAQADLRDILHLTPDGKVQVTPPTRKLGKSQADQARTVIALVAGARAHGLDEQPVNAELVRREAERKRCFQTNNFAGKHLGPLKGFNAGSNRNEILLTSKWIDEFKAAVDQAHERGPEER